MKKNILLLGSYTLFWFVIDFILQLNVNRTYTLVDDHTIISTLNFTSENSWWSYFLEIIQDKERFRPLMGIHRLFYVMIFGAEIKFIAYYYLFLAGLTSFFLHKYCTLLGFNWQKSLLFTVLVLFGMQGVIWWVYDSSENIGMLFMSIALYTGYKAFEYNEKRLIPVFILFVVLMSLSKESFVFILPFFAILFRKKRWVSVLLLVLCVIEIGYIKLFIGTTFGYAGVDNSSYSPANLIKVIGQYLIRGYGIPLLILLAYLLYENKTNLRDFILKNRFYWVILLIGVAPFLLLYAKSGINVGRYLFPLLIPQLFVLFNLVEQMTNSSIKKALLLVILLLLGYHSVKFVQIQRDFVDENKRLKGFYSIIEAEISANEELLVLANPVEDFEKAGALMIYLHSSHSLNRKNAKMGIVDLKMYAAEEPVYGMFKKFYSRYLLEDNNTFGSYTKWLIINPNVLDAIERKGLLTKPHHIYTKDNYTLVDFTK